jgi:hypothetical protein
LDNLVLSKEISVGHVHVSSDRSVRQVRGNLRTSHLGSLWTCFFFGGGGGGGGVPLRLGAEGYSHGQRKGARRKERSRKQDGDWNGKRKRWKKIMKNVERTKER